MIRFSSNERPAIFDLAFPVRHVCDDVDHINDNARARRGDLSAGELIRKKVETRDSD